MRLRTRKAGLAPPPRSSRSASGANSDRNQLTPREQDAVFGELGRYAKQIHAIKNPQGWFGAPAPLKPFRKWSEFRSKPTTPARAGRGLWRTGPVRKANPCD